MVATPDALSYVRATCWNPPVQTEPDGDRSTCWVFTISNMFVKTTPPGSSQRWTPMPLALLFHSMRGRKDDVSVGAIHAPTVNPPPVPTSVVAEAVTFTLASMPLKLKACPTAPALNVIPPWSVPLLPP